MQRPWAFLYFQFIASASLAQEGLISAFGMSSRRPCQYIPAPGLQDAMIQECARTGCLKRENIYGLAVMDTGRLDKVSSAEQNIRVRSPGAATRGNRCSRRNCCPRCFVPYVPFHLSLFLPQPPRRVASTCVRCSTSSRRAAGFTMFRITKPCLMGLESRFRRDPESGSVRGFRSVLGARSLI